MRKGKRRISSDRMVLVMDGWMGSSAVMGNSGMLLWRIVSRKEGLYDVEEEEDGLDWISIDKKALQP